MRILEDGVVEDGSRDSQMEGLELREPGQQLNPALAFSAPAEQSVAAEG